MTLLFFFLFGLYDPWHGTLKWSVQTGQHVVTSLSIDSQSRANRFAGPLAVQIPSSGGICKLQ